MCHGKVLGGGGEQRVVSLLPPMGSVGQEVQVKTTLEFCWGERPAEKALVGWKCHPSTLNCLHLSFGVGFASFFLFCFRSPHPSQPQFESTLPLMENCLHLARKNPQSASLLPQDGILLGAVGAYDWNGAVLKETSSGKVIPLRESYLQEFPEELKNHGAYLGEKDK